MIRKWIRRNPIVTYGLVVYTFGLLMGFLNGRLWL